MIKKVLFFVGFFMFVLPAGNVFAEVVSTPVPHDYKNGLLDDDFIIKSNTLQSKLYDNDINSSSSYTFNQLLSGVVTFNYPVNITGLFLYMTVHEGYKPLLIVHYDDDEIDRLIIDTHIYDYYSYQLDNVVKIELIRPTSGTNMNRIHEIDFFGSYEIPELIDISNLVYTSTHDEVKLNYELPDEFDFIEINANGKTYETTDDNFTIDNLDPDTEYEITIYTILDGMKSEGVTLTVKTDKEPEPEPDPVEKEVTNLKANTKHNRVDLSWTLPSDDGFNHVTIYRKILDNQTSSLLNLLIPKAFASGYNPIFETNGTYFNDLTVEAATPYEYKLTSNYDNEETPGVTIQAITPPPIVEGTGFTENPDGDYVYSWNYPTTGQVKIFVGGNEYATVDASEGSFTIPENDMTYTPLGDPDVGLQAIAPNGTPGNVQSSGILGGINLPFTAKDLILSGNGLLYLVGSFVLLALAFLLIPRLIKLIRVSVVNNKRNMPVSGRARL